MCLSIAFTTVEHVLLDVLENREPSAACLVRHRLSGGAGHPLVNSGALGEESNGDGGEELFEGHS